MFEWFDPSPIEPFNSLKSDPYLFRGWTGDLQPELDGRRREVETAVESQNPWEIKQVALSGGGASVKIISKIQSKI